MLSRTRGTPRRHGAAAIASLLFAAALVGCGGGGSSQGPSQSTGTSNQQTNQQANQQANQQGGQQTGQTTDQGVELPMEAIEYLTASAMTLQQDVPTPEYASDSWQLAAFNDLNERRSRCGFGKLAQSSALDIAAQSHSAYLVRLVQDVGWNAAVLSDAAVLAGQTSTADNFLSLHEENPSRPLFTGVTATDRGKAAGYLGGVNEVLTWEVSNNQEDLTTSPLLGLLATAYHMRDLITEARDIGLGMSFREQADPWYNQDGSLGGIVTGTESHVVANTGTVGYAQRSTSQTLTYPCEGITGVGHGTYGEVPDPTNGQGFTQPIGPGIIVQAPYGVPYTHPAVNEPAFRRSTLKITSASVTPVASLDGRALSEVTHGTKSYVLGQPHPFGILVLDKETDGNGMIGYPDTAFVHTHRPLARGVTYQVELGFTVDGVAQVRSFQFSTDLKVLGYEEF